MARRLGKALRMWCAEKPEFVAQDVQAKLVDIFRRHPLNALRWVTPSKSAPTSNDYCLTPFGLLELRLDLGWTAFRNGEPLVHPACRLWHGESGVWPGPLYRLRCSEGGGAYELFRRMGYGLQLF